MEEKIKKVSIIVSKGSLDGVYPGLIMANGARMDGIEANLFFTFFGMDAIIKKRMGRIKVATVGNPGMHMPSLIGILPGMSAMATAMMTKTMDKLDIPPVPEYHRDDRRRRRQALRLQGDRGHVQARRKRISAPRSIPSSPSAQFYEKAAGGHIIFT